MRSPPQLLFLRPSSALRSQTLGESFIQHHHQKQASRIPCLRQTRQTRPLVTNPLAPTTQTLLASRTLSYPASSLYKLISDIESYPLFLPYCTGSTITARSPPDPQTGESWPQAADLRVGWGPYDEVFHSKVFCVPGSIVEAVSGPEARTSLTANELPHHDSSSLGDTASNPIFSSLITRWTLREYPFKPLPPDGKSPQEGSASEPSKPQTEVNLKIEVKFANAVYAALSKAAAPKVAGIMVQAFEERAREVLGEGYGGVEECRKMAKGVTEEKSTVDRVGGH